MSVQYPDMLAVVDLVGFVGFVVDLSGPSGGFTYHIW